MNTPITFELAKLLKEKGFDKPTNLLYQLNGTLHTVIPNSDYPHLKVHNNKEIDYYTNGFLNWNGLDLDEDERLDLYSEFNERYDDAFSVCCTAPTIVDVIMWLYEKHSIWIHSAPENNEEDIVKWAFTIQTIDTEVRFVRRFSDFNKPTEAYEAGIKYCLTELI